MLGIPNASTSLQSISPSFLCLFVFSPTWKGSHENLIISLRTTIYYLTLHINSTPDYITYNGRHRSCWNRVLHANKLVSSLSIALIFFCVDHLRACEKNQFFLLDLIQIISPPWTLGLFDNDIILSGQMMLGFLATWIPHDDLRCDRVLDGGLPP